MVTWCGSLGSLEFAQVGKIASSDRRFGSKIDVESVTGIGLSPGCPPIKDALF